MKYSCHDCAPVDNTGREFVILTNVAKEGNLFIRSAINLSKRRIKDENGLNYSWTSTMKQRTCVKEKKKAAAATTEKQTTKIVLKTNIGRCPLATSRCSWSDSLIVLSTVQAGRWRQRHFTLGRSEQVWIVLGQNISPLPSDRWPWQAAGEHNTWFTGWIKNLVPARSTAPDSSIYNSDQQAPYNRQRRLSTI